MSNMDVAVSFFHKQAINFTEVLWTSIIIHSGIPGGEAKQHRMLCTVHNICVSYVCLGLPWLQRGTGAHFCAGGVSVCSAKRRGLLLALFQERIPWGLQELLTEMEGSGQEWWEGKRGGRLLYTLRGLSGSHLQAWLNDRMLYENKNIICLLKGQERPSNWLPRAFVLPHVLCCALVNGIVQETCLQSFSYTLISSAGMYQHCDTELTETVSERVRSLGFGMFVFPAMSSESRWFAQLYSLHLSAAN